MKESIFTLLKLPDRIISKIYLKFFQEKNSLMIFNFHGFFRNEKEKMMDLVDPQTWTTIDDFHQFIEYFLNNDYNFISPNDILNGLNNDKKYIMISFDDGYYNNKHALKILRKYDVPIVLFPSIDHVAQNKCFWWDVLYREKIKSQLSKDIFFEQNQLKLKTNEKIEKYIVETFGKEAFKPRSDIDRPFTTLELRDFSKEKYVFLGNHTSSHAILTNYSSDGIKSQILDAQNAINEITGATPIIISYPNGNYSDEILKISKELGIKIGVTTTYNKNNLPLNSQIKRCMYLGRFDVSGCNDVIKQCELFRSDILLYPRIYDFLNKKSTR